MSFITLVRHGQASAGTDNYDRLSELGQQQARYLGDWWSKTDLAPTAAFAGTLERQQHTASLALDHAKLSSIDVRTLPELNEYAHNDVDREFGQGFSSDSGVALSFEDYLGILERWRDAPDHALNGVESWNAFMARGVQAMHQAHEAVGEDGHALLFTSGGIVSTLIAAVQSHPFEVIVENIWNVRNSSLTTLHFDGKRARLLDFNRVSHLDVHRDPELVTLI